MNSASQKVRVKLDKKGNSNLSFSERKSSGERPTTPMKGEPSVGDSSRDSDE